MIYPEHIYDPVRLEIAQQLLEKEFAKLFPTVNSATLHDTTLDWRKSPDKYHLEDGIRDFWDTFAALMESIKLKSQFVSFITAENYSWQKLSIPVREIMLSSKLAQLDEIDNLVWQARSTTVGNVLDALTDSTSMQRQKELNDAHSTSNQDVYPIIVRGLPNASLQVMDGNRRSLRAGLYGKDLIDAWVGTTTDEVPKNFWVPVNDLYQLVKLYRLSTTDKQKQSVRNSLEIYFRASSIARTNYELWVAGVEWSDGLLAMRPIV